MSILDKFEIWLQNAVSQDLYELLFFPSPVALNRLIHPPKQKLPRLSAGVFCVLKSGVILQSD